MSKRLHHYLLKRKLSLLDLNTFLFNWILDFLLGNAISSITTLTTGTPQACGVCESTAFHAAVSHFCHDACLKIHHEQQWQISLQRRDNGAAWKLMQKKRCLLMWIQMEVASIPAKIPEEPPVSLYSEQNNPSSCSHRTHSLQRDHKEHPEQLWHGLAWELHHVRLQGSIADSENN